MKLDFSLEEFFNDPIPERVQRWAKQAKMAGAADEESSALICLNCALGKRKGKETEKDLDLDLFNLY